MPASKAEQMLDALKGLLETVPNVSVERNSVLPEKVPDGGLIIPRDGHPGEPEQALGGFLRRLALSSVDVRPPAMMPWAMSMTPRSSAMRARVRAIRGDAEIRSIPIIGVSAHAMVGDRELPLMTSISRPGFEKSQPGWGASVTARRAGGLNGILAE